MQELGVIIRPYVHLQHVNLNNNRLKEVSEVMHLTWLLTLTAAGNGIRDIKFFDEFNQTMQYINVSAFANSVADRLQP